MAFFKKPVWMLALAGLALLARPERLVSDAPPERPNLVVIMSDDQTVETMRVMAKTRELLAARGTTFANSFASYPLCCPSRATFFTGQYAHNHGVLHNKVPLGGFDRFDPEDTLPIWLQEAGYYTAHVGKYLNRYGMAKPAEVPPGWSRWFALVDPTTYRMYDYTVLDDGVFVRYGKSDLHYQTDVLAEKAEEVIRERAGTGQPFFLSVAPLAPHRENGVHPSPRPAPRHLGRFARASLPSTKAFNETNVRDKPRHMRAFPPLNSGEVAAITEIYRAQLASLLAVDDLVERLVVALEETGELDNTVIIYTSDNGFFRGEHRIPDGKFFPYEEAIRVPLISRGGGFPAGRTALQPVANVDLAATLVALAGARAGRPLDGRPLLPLALDPNLAKDRSILIEGFNDTLSRPGFRGVRTARYLYLEYQTGEQELYDLEKDPQQLDSRHAVSRYGRVRADLAARLARLRDCAGATCRF